VAGREPIGEGDVAKAQQAEVAAQNEVCARCRYKAGGGVASAEVVGNIARGARQVPYGASVPLRRARDAEPEGSRYVCW